MFKHAIFKIADTGTFHDRHFQSTGLQDVPDRRRSFAGTATTGDRIKKQRNGLICHACG
jgi:hypothetical protein